MLSVLYLIIKKIRTLIKFSIGETNQQISPKNNYLKSLVVSFVVICNKITIYISLDNNFYIRKTKRYILSLKDNISR